MSGTMNQTGYGTISSTRSGYSLDGTLRGGCNHTSKMPEKNMAAGSSCFKYNFALVSRIANTFVDKSSFDLVSKESHIDLDKARHEHEQLVDSLRRIGLDVIELPSDDQHPDGLFVDDIAVVINGTALICNPKPIHGKPSRLGELPVVRQVLRKELGLKIIEVDSETANVEGGDVLWTGREIFVGLSERTNKAGANAVAKAFPEYATSTVEVPAPAIHLKSCVSMAGPDVIAVSKVPYAQKILSQMRQLGGIGYKYISVDEPEASSVLYCNGSLLHLPNEIIPHGFSVFENKIDYPRIAVNLTEPLKRKGCLNQCVLLIARTRHPKKIPSTLP